MQAPHQEHVGQGIQKTYSYTDDKMKQKRIHRFSERKLFREFLYASKETSLVKNIISKSRRHATLLITRQVPLRPPGFF